MTTFMWLLSWAASIIGYFVLFLLWAAVVYIYFAFIYEYTSVCSELRKHPGWDEGLTRREIGNLKLHAVFLGAEKVTISDTAVGDIDLSVKRIRTNEK